MWEGMLLAFGNPLLDISATCDEDFLQKYNLKANDAILAEESHLPMYPEMKAMPHVEYIAGGSTQNSMRVFQWIIGEKKVASFMGCIGKDQDGDTLKEKSLEAGLNAVFQYSDDKPTGSCAVVVTGGGKQRSLCANLGAASCFTKDHIEVPANWALLESAEYFYISGYFLVASLETALEVAQDACKKGKVFCMNLSAPYISTAFKDRIFALYPYIDIIFGNEEEALAFAESKGLGVTDPKEIALRMAELPKANEKRERTVIITQGSDSVIIVEGKSLVEIPVPQLKPEEIYDTNGAGDAFVGGFMAQYVQGKSVEECVKCGIWAAQQIIQQLGCTFPKDLKYKS
ncbi:unnamed protein product [Darwinula stevensoni]|uniref:Adenosine kinase n=1 Tax=Darwinula stevensoni TaxID=69355 RepID=A0A7R8X508_9CRUS|nr:unnamed protein product [Darwinula stevensoni]CAG0886635.1 unnamed protein product [Darwinula stevensoni]